MLDVEDGPSRKVSRSRKRNSSSAKATPVAERSKRQRQSEQTPEINTEKQSKTSPDKVSPLKQSDWFANSFSAHGRVDDHQARTRLGNKLTSTPKAIRRRSSKHGRKVSPQSNREPSESNSLDASDLLLAEMDMGHMGSDNSQSELNTEITNQPVCATQKPNVTVQSKTKVTNQLQPTAQTSTTPIQNVTVQSKTSVTNQLQPTAQASTNQIQNVTVQSKTSVTNQLQPAAPASTNQIQVCNSVSSSLISNNNQSKVQNNKDSIHAEDTSLFETNRDTSLCKENLSLSKSVESQYFQKSDTQLELHLPTKFANYKHTQVIIENNLQRCSGRIGTPFNFLSVSCGTPGTDCEKSMDNLSFLKSQSCKNDNVTPLSLSKHPTNSSSCNKQGLCSKQCSENCTSKIKSSNILQSQYLSTQKISGETEICSQLPDSEEWNNDELVSSTQFHSTQVHKTRNCAASTQLHRGLKANPVPKVASSEVIPVPTQGLFSTQSECTQLPRTQSQPTQLQSSQFEGPGTQITQTGTGNRNYRFTQGQFTQNGTQIQSSVCDRTGLIVDTQSNQNDCDISSDMFVDDDACERMATQNICSNTQSLGEKTDRRQRHRRSSRLNTQETLDDDLDTIQQEMQKRRKTIKSDIGKSQQTFCKAQAISKDATDQKRISMETNKDGIDTHSNRNNNISASINPCKLDVGKGNMTCAQQKESIHINKDAVSIGNEKGGNNAVLGTSGPATPGGAGSLHERLKKRLKENAGQRTPNGPASIVEKLREQVLERVNMEAAKSREETSANDIGPFYGLPTKVKHLFETHRGITSLYDWQDECLKLPAIVERRNLIYSLPTSGGKTLVAEILILQELLCRKSDALLILPFVSIVQEKVRNLSQFAVDLDFLVEEYAGSKGRFPPTKRRKNNTLYVATMEKAHSIVNSLIEHGRMDCLGLVVVDELHMIGEGGSRGATLESTLMKILHSSASCQIIGMSATLNNIEDLKQFLNADVYTNDFRPVQLTEYIKLSENIYSVDNEAKCPDDQILHSRIVCFQYKPEMEKTDPDHLFGLVLEVVPENSCLVFCPTKKNCENVAMMLAKMMVRYKRELSNVKKTERKDLLKQLYNDAEGKICPILQYTLHFGIAYHHSGLTMDERKLIEEAYSDGTLCLLACTSTLAAGVNLPAKRVILRGPYVGQEFISRSQYKQMVGRAGRAGIDTSGESILICKSTDRKRVCDLMAGPLESCQSSLVYNDGKGVRNLILSTIGLKVTTTTNDVFQFVNRSLVQVQQQALNIDILDVCKTSLQTLIDLDLVKQVCDPAVDPELYQLEVTSLGKATFKGPVDPDNAGRLYRDLRRAEDPLVVSNHLHLLYLVTPYDMVRDLTPSWFIYFQQMNSLDAAELKVASLIGVPESYIAKRASQQKCKQKVDDLTVNRFYLTLMLYDLWKQKLIWDVAEKFQQQRGFIQNLLSSAASFASCVNHFCQELEEFWAYQALLGDFVKRLSYCVTAELIPLMEIPGVKLGRARLMYKAGYRTLGAVANTDAEILVKAIQHLPRKVAKQIVASAQLLLNEKADAMMEEVEELVSIPQGFAVTMATTDVLDSTVMSTPEMSQNSAATSQTSQQ